MALKVSQQLVAARALLRWTQDELAEASGVGVATIKRIEAAPGPISAYESTIEKLARCLARAGIEFLNGGRPGVRLAHAPKCR